MDTAPLLPSSKAPTPCYALWLFFSLVGGMIYGYNVSIAPSLPYLADDLNLTTSQQEMASASATLSDTLTMLAGGHLADAFGRRPTAIAACALSVFGAIGNLAFHSSLSYFLFWRLCAGIGNALSILILPMYISESVDVARRGRCISLYQLGVLTGTLVPYVVMLLSENWLLTFALGAVPGLFTMACFFSGYFTERRHEASRQTAPEKPHLLAAPSASLPQLSHATLLVVGILLAYSNNSIDLTLFYGPTIISQFIQSSSRVSANLIGLCLSSLSVVSVGGAAIFLRSTFPRRSFYLVCHGIVVVCFLAASVLFTSATENASLDARALFLLVVLGLLVLFQTCGPGLLFVLIVSELFEDPVVRATSMGYCTFAMSGFSLVINGTLLSLFAALGVGGTFAAYGLSYAACWAVFYKYLPETSTRQIQH